MSVYISFVSLASICNDLLELGKVIEGDFSLPSLVINPELEADCLRELLGFAPSLNLTSFL